MQFTDDLVVVINCTHLESIHPKLFSSLYSQNLNFKILIQESDCAPVRLQILPKISSKYVVFLDQDVELTCADYLNKIVITLKKSSADILLTGFYLSAKNTTYLSRCYNIITNLWISSNSIKVDNYLYLNTASGGIWALENNPKIHPHIKDLPLVWGGEDALAIRELRRLNYSVLRTEALDVIHHNNSEFFHFLFRAWKQGQARSRWQLKSSNRNTSFGYRVLFSRFSFGLVLHQLVVEIGSLFESAKSLIAKIIPINPPIK